MKKSETKKNKADILKEIDEKQLSLRDLRFGIAGSKNKNVKAARNTKREIARLKTALKGAN